jgi:rhomboid protease GluP
VGVNEEKCPFCGAWRPGLFGWATVLRRSLGGRLDLFRLIIGTCATLYAVALLISVAGGANILGGGLFSILSPSSSALYQLGMTGGFAWEQGWWLTLLTAMYLHGSPLHIIFNVMWIRNLGPAVAEAYGPGRAFLLFNVAGAGGFLASNLLNGVPGLLMAVVRGDLMFGSAIDLVLSGRLAVPTIGASGAIFGLLAALIVYGRRRGSSVMTQQLWQWAIILGVFGFLLPEINNWAHGGGFAAGLVGAQFMNLDDERQDSSWVWLTSLGLIVVTLVGVGLSFVRVTGILLG